MLAPRQRVPTSLTVVSDTPIRLLYLEIINDTSQPITFSAYDSQGLCVIPNRQIDAAAVMTYESKFGAPVSGLRWKASAEGLVGWFHGETQ